MGLAQARELSFCCSVIRAFQGDASMAIRFESATNQLAEETYGLNATVVQRLVLVRIRNDQATKHCVDLWHAGLWKALPGRPCEEFAGLDGGQFMRAKNSAGDERLNEQPVLAPNSRTGAERASISAVINRASERPEGAMAPPTLRGFPSRSETRTCGTDLSSEARRAAAVYRRRATLRHRGGR
jgi:hypothetical protein